LIIIDKKIIAISDGEDNGYTNFQFWHYILPNGRFLAPKFVRQANIVQQTKIPSGGSCLLRTTPLQIVHNVGKKLTKSEAKFVTCRAPRS